MVDEWFSEPGATGTVTVERREDGWYLADSHVETEINCLLSSDFRLDESSGEQRIEATVTACMRGTGDSIDYLHLKPPATPPVSEDRTKTPLEEIAEAKIGSHEFTLSEDTDDSAVESAKRRARKQGRDPAIDPRFR
jgi:hypothetical protein